MIRCKSGFLSQSSAFSPAERETAWRAHRYVITSLLKKQRCGVNLEGLLINVICSLFTLLRFLRNILFLRLVLINYFLSICFKERLSCIRKKVSWQAKWKENIALHASQSTWPNKDSFWNLLLPPRIRWMPKEMCHAWFQHQMFAVMLIPLRLKAINAHIWSTTTRQGFA